MAGGYCQRKTVRLPVLGLLRLPATSVLKVEEGGGRSVVAVLSIYPMNASRNAEAVSSLQNRSNKLAQPNKGLLKVVIIYPFGHFTNAYLRICSVAPLKILLRNYLQMVRGSG